MTTIILLLAALWFGFSVWFLINRRITKSKMRDRIHRLRAQANHYYDGGRRDLWREYHRMADSIQGIYEDHFGPLEE